MSLNYKKFNFPLVAEMPVKPDMEIIKSFLDTPGLEWEDPFTSQPGISMVNGEVAETTYETIEHLCLTGPLDNEDIVGILSPEERRKLSNDYWKEVPVKSKIEGTAGHLMNEYNWKHPLPFYKDTALHKHLTDLFKAPIIRVRYSKMKPGAVIPPHIDYNTTYAVRFIIPIDGNEGVVDRFWCKNESQDFEMENGKCYFLNIGYKHAVYHNGPKTRVYLIGSLGGQEDILPLLK